MVSITAKHDWTPGSRPIKERTRQALFMDMRRKKSILLMPGNLGRDLELAIQFGVVTKRTKITCVEKDEDELDALKKRIKCIVPSGFQQPVFFGKDIFTISLPSSVDFAWIDLCGNLREKDLFWFSNMLVPNLLPNTELAFTFSKRFRANKLIKGLLTHLEEHRQERIFIESGRFPLFLDVKLQRMMVAQYELLKSLLCPYEFECELYYYKDLDFHRKNHTMILFKIFNLKTNVKKPSVVQLDKLSDFTTSNVRNLPMATQTFGPAQIVQAFVEAKTAGTKAKATRWFNMYVKQEKRKGRDPARIRAGIKASVTRKKNGN
tara:strand:+ start:1082 stop:2041 length:960 start_codon:yes stop_codon:yes gene_type:complete